MAVSAAAFVTASVALIVVGESIDGTDHFWMLDVGHLSVALVAGLLINRWWAILFPLLWIPVGIASIPFEDHRELSLLGYLLAGTIASGLQAAAVLIGIAARRLIARLG